MFLLNLALGAWLLAKELPTRTFRCLAGDSEQSIKPKLRIFYQSASKTQVPCFGTQNGTINFWGVWPTAITQSHILSISPSSVSDFIKPFIFAKDMPTLFESSPWGSLKYFILLLFFALKTNVQ